jgi:hypothetical protein
MLKRHEVEILLKAGPQKAEVARLTGVALCSVKRIAEENPVVHVDDVTAFVRDGLLDQRAQKQNLCPLVPASVPSGMPVLHSPAASNTAPTMTRRARGARPRQ